MFKSKYKILTRIFTLYENKMSASNPLAHILETNRLIEINYKDWLGNLKYF